MLAIITAHCTDFLFLSTITDSFYLLILRMHFSLEFPIHFQEKDFSFCFENNFNRNEFWIIPINFRLISNVFQSIVLLHASQKICG